MKRKVLIIGAGKLGQHLANQLSLEGQSVTILDNDEEKIRFLPVTYGGFSYVGDGTDFKTLSINNAQDCDLAIIVTGSDDQNILSAHICKFLFNIKKVIVRVSDPKKRVLVDDMDIEVISPFNLALDTLSEILKKEIES